MIRTFTSRKMLFTPVGFLNSVARWILGIRSNTGTIRITNTANPSEENGPSIDIDANETAKKPDAILSEKYPKSGSVKLLGTSMKWDAGRLSVDGEWLSNEIQKNLESSTEPDPEQEQTTDNTEASTATDATDPFDSDSDFEDWDTDDKKILKLRLYAIVSGDAGGPHSFHPIDLEFSKSGMLKSVKKVEDKSIMIGA